MTHAKEIVQHVDGEQQAQQHVVERQQLDAMYLAGTWRHAFGDSEARLRQYSRGVEYAGPETEDARAVEDQAQRLLSTQASRTWQPASTFFNFYADHTKRAAPS